MNTSFDRLCVRKKVLTWLGASEDECKELLLYNENRFRRADVGHFPLPDEPFVSDWEIYAKQCEEAKSILPLQSHLIELRFPIQDGVSQTAEYTAAMRRGIDPGNLHNSCALSLVAPDKVKLLIHATPAGRIPLLIAAVREDFVTLVRALSRRNEPALISDSMGACIISGYNNWSRMHGHLLRLGRGDIKLSEARRRMDFQAIASDKSLYQDRLILLSSGPYSSVDGAHLGLQDDEWIRLSMIIRREHECAHYFTRRVFGSMRNAVLDELIADFAGITAALGTFRADWFMHFIGLENYPRYRPKARLENYRGAPPISDGAFVILHKLARDAASNLERFAQRHRNLIQDPKLRPRLLTVLSCLTLEELASSQGDEFLASTLSHIQDDMVVDQVIATDHRVPDSVS